MASPAAPTFGFHTTHSSPAATHLGCDVKGPVPTHSNLLLHHAEAVEPAEQEASTLHPQVEIHIVTQEPARDQRRDRWHGTQLMLPPTRHTRVSAPVLGAAEGELARCCPTHLPIGRHRGKANKENRRSCAV